MLNIRELKKDALYTVMLEQLYSLNYMWMRLEGFIQVNAPQAYGSEEYYQLQEDYGSYEARRLVKALGFQATEIGDLAKFVRHSHWAVFENIEICELTPRSFKMRTIACSAQRAAQRWGMEYYDCATAGTRIRRGFFKGINPQAEVRRILTPPEAGPKGTGAGVSCEWLISLA